MRFGEIIKRARKGKFSQQSLGERIGVWGTYIGQIEKGDRVPSDERCHLLAKALELDPQNLLISAYKERAQTRDGRRLFTQMEKLMTDPVVSQVIADPKMLDASIIEALKSPTIRKVLKNRNWREALEDSAWANDRDIPDLIRIIAQIPPQQWEALLSTAKAFAGMS
jgi:transcriptional regulator with XRE-family HTH domain